MRRPVRRNLLLLAAAALAAGCGDSGDSLLGRAAAMLASGTGPGPGGPQPSGFTGVFAPEVMAASPERYIVLSIPTFGREEAARLIADNGTGETFQAQGGWTAAYDDGMLIATRGLGDDLWASDGSATRAAIRAGGGPALRRMEFIDDQDQIAIVELSCRVVADGTERLNLGLREVDTRKFTETCESSRVIFENAYWVAADGSIVSSRQFVSVGVAYLRSNRL